MKEFLMLIREHPGQTQVSVEAMQAEIEAHLRWVETLVEKGHFKAGNPLDTEGLVLHGDRITDGPFIETKECVSGYYFLLAESLAQAAELAKDCPSLQYGATLEIRPVLDTDE